MFEILLMIIFACVITLFSWFWDIRKRLKNGKSIFF